MVLHRWNSRPANLAEAGARTNYNLERLAEQTRGMIVRGVVTAVRPTGAGMEFKLPLDENGDAVPVYLVDVTVGNPSGMPVVIRGIESTIPLRPGQGVRLAIPPATVEQAIVAGRVTPPMQEILDWEVVNPIAPLNLAGLYPVIGAVREWTVIVTMEPAGQAPDITLNTSHPLSGTLGAGVYPESIHVAGRIIINIEGEDGALNVSEVPFGVVMYQHEGGVPTLQYDAEVRAAGVIDIAETVLPAPDAVLTAENSPVMRNASLVVVVDTIRQADVRSTTSGGPAIVLTQIAGGTPTISTGTVLLMWAETGIGTQ